MNGREYLEQDSIALLLRLLTRLANCGLDSGAPTLLPAAQPTA
ncbi:MAG: hypothetical protein WD054_01060 [Gemmatimonadota bacterium]